MKAKQAAKKAKPRGVWVVIGMLPIGPASYSDNTKAGTARIAKIWREQGQLTNITGPVFIPLEARS